MKFEYTITDELGIHARPAGLLVERVKKFESKITISLKDKTVDVSSIMKIMMLQAKKNDIVTIEATGSDEEEAIDTLKVFMRVNF